MKKIFLVTTLLSLPLFVNAAQIRWNEVEVNMYVEGGQGLCAIEWFDESRPGVFFQVFCDFVSTPWGQEWSLTPTAAMPGGVRPDRLIMYEADAGSIVNNEATQQSTYFVNVHGGYMNASDSAEPWTPLSDSDPLDDHVYLAIILIDYDGNETYGWVEILVSGYNGEGHILAWNSALDLDGGPMIVGGGSATPEPSSGLLLLVGGALLALRRRKHGRPVRADGVVSDRSHSEPDQSMGRGRCKYVSDCAV